MWTYHIFHDVSRFILTFRAYKMGIIWSIERNNLCMVWVSAESWSRNARARESPCSICWVIDRPCGGTETTHLPPFKDSRSFSVVATPHTVPAFTILPHHHECYWCFGFWGSNFWRARNPGYCATQPKRACFPNSGRRKLHVRSDAPTFGLLRHQRN